MTLEDIKRGIRCYKGKADDAGVIRTIASVDLHIDANVTEEMDKDPQIMKAHWEFMAEALIENIREALK